MCVRIAPEPGGYKNLGLTETNLLFFLSLSVLVCVAARSLAIRPGATESTAGAERRFSFSISRHHQPLKSKSH